MINCFINLREKATCNTVPNYHSFFPLIWKQKCKKAYDKLTWTMKNLITNNDLYRYTSTKLILYNCPISIRKNLKFHTYSMSMFLHFIWFYLYSMSIFLHFIWFYFNSVCHLLKHSHSPVAYILLMIYYYYVLFFRI